MTSLKLPIAKATELLNLRIELGNKLDAAGSRRTDAWSREYEAWNSYNRTLLKQTFTDSEPYDEYHAVRTGMPIVSPLQNAHKLYIEAQYNTFQRRLRLLQSFIEQLELYDESPTGEEVPMVRGRNVFIVHDHDEATRETTARVLERLDLNVVIL